MNSVDQLCPNCGLCCNGVLFADVELQPGDDAGRLAALGMALKKKGGQRAFVQPCRCLTAGSATFTPTGRGVAGCLNAACSSASRPAR